MAEKAKIDILINDAGAAQTLGELEQSAADLREELGKTKIGTEEYKKLNQALVNTTREVKNLELGFEALDNEGMASELGSVAGAIGDVTSAVILLGGENETLEQMARNIEMALGVSIAFKGAIEGLSSARKLWNNVLKQSNTLTVIATTVQKAFNLVLKANPIGLIITAIGLLITGLVILSTKVKAVGQFFVDLGAKVKDIIDGFGAWKGVILALLGPIGWLIAAWDYFFGEQTKQLSELEKQRAKDEAIRKKRMAAITKAHQERLNQIQEEREAEEDAFGDRQEIFDLDIARMEAEGKNSDELKKAKIEDQLEHERVVLESIKKQIDSWRKFYEEQFTMSGKSKDEFLALMKGRGIDLVELEKQANDLIAEQQKKIYSAETDLIRFNRELREKNTKETKKEAKEVYDAEKALNDARMDFLRRLEAAETEYLDSKLSKEQQEINAVRDKYFVLIEEAKKFNSDKLQLDEDIALLELAQDQRIAEIKKQWLDQNRQDKADALAEEINKTTDQAEQLISIATSLNQIISSREMKRIQDKIDAGEKLTNREIKMLQRQDKINKAFAVAQIAADTARGISGAIAAGAGIPFPGNIAAIISGVSAVLAGVAQAQAVLGESLELPSIGDVGQEEQRSDNTQNVPSFNAAEFGSSLLNQDQKVYVVESDISGVQKKVSAIESQATF